MKRLIARIAVAVATASILVASVVVGGSVAGAQDDFYPQPTVPDCQGFDANGNLTVSFAGLDFKPGGRAQLYNSAGVLVSEAAMSAAGIAVFTDAVSLAGQPVTFRWETTTNVWNSSATKQLDAVTTPTPIPPHPTPTATATPTIVKPTMTVPTPTPKLIVDPVKPPMQPTLAPTPTPGKLAYTGSDTEASIMIGSGLVLIGGLAIIASRRREDF